MLPDFLGEVDGDVVKGFEINVYNWLGEQLFEEVQLNCIKLVRVETEKCSECPAFYKVYRFLVPERLLKALDIIKRILRRGDPELIDTAMRILKTGDYEALNVFWEVVK